MVLQPENGDKRQGGQECLFGAPSPRSLSCGYPGGEVSLAFVLMENKSDLRLFGWVFFVFVMSCFFVFYPESEFVFSVYVSPHGLDATASARQPALTAAAALEVGGRRERQKRPSDSNHCCRCCSFGSIYKLFDQQETDRVLQNIFITNEPEIMDSLCV